MFFTHRHWGRPRGKLCVSSFLFAFPFPTMEMNEVGVRRDRVVGRGQSTNLDRLEIFFKGAPQPRSLCTVSANLLTHVCCAGHRQFLGDPNSASLPSVLKANLPNLPYAHRNGAANRVPYPTTLLLSARRPKAAAPPYSLFRTRGRVQRVVAAFIDDSSAMFLA